MALEPIEVSNFLEQRLSEDENRSNDDDDDEGTDEDDNNNNYSDADWDGDSDDEVVTKTMKKRKSVEKQQNQGERIDHVKEKEAMRQKHVVIGNKVFMCLPSYDGSFHCEWPGCNKVVSQKGNL